MPQDHHLKIPQHIARLEEHAFLPFIPQSHKCYVVHPLVEPPQACLVVREENGEELWEFALIAAPWDAPVSDEIQDRAYAVALGLINAAYKPVMKQPFSEAMLSLWEGSWEDRPFCDKSRDTLIHDIRSFVAAPSTKHLSIQNITEQIEDICEQHHFGRKAWAPIVLHHGRSPFNRDNSWEIARAWKNCNLGQYTRDGCAKKLTELGLYDGDLSETAKNTFGRKLARLGLRLKYHINQRH